MNHLRSENDYVKNGIFEKIDQNDIEYSDDLWSKMHTNLDQHRLFFLASPSIEFKNLKQYCQN